MLQQLHRRDLILLAGATALACITVFGVMGLILNHQARTMPVVNQTPVTAAATPRYTVAYQDVTGLSQFTPARAAAIEWAGDAQLVAASSNWPTVLKIEEVGQPSPWVYRFYSPAQKRMFFVTVLPDGQLETVEHRPEVTLPPRIVDTGIWLTDSPTALAFWLDAGGADLLHDQPGIELLIQLRETSDADGPAWLVTGVDNRTEDILNIVVDANQGVVTRAN